MMEVSLRLEKLETSMKHARSNTSRIPPYHPRSNRQAERFMNTLKRALKKATATPTERVLQQFLQVHKSFWEMGTTKKELGTCYIL